MKRAVRARPDSIPAVVYGAFQDPVSVAVSPREISKILRSNTGYNTIFNLAIAGGETTPVMVVDQQVDPDQGHPAARRPEAHRSDQAHPRHRSGAHRGRAQGRQGAGRPARDDHPRNRNRVPAGRDSGRLHGGRHGADDRPEQARQRCRRLRLHEAGERPANRDRARRHAARRSRAAPRPKRPRLRLERLPSPKSSRRARRKKKPPTRRTRARRSNLPCSWWPVWGIRARSTRTRRITWGSWRSTGWPSGTASASTGRIPGRSSVWAKSTGIR